MWTAFGEYLHNKKPNTNADRIRAMSDEELAEFQAERIVVEKCLCLKDEGYEITEVQRMALKSRLYNTWLAWLKQPAEGE